MCAALAASFLGEDGEHAVEISFCDPDMRLVQDPIQRQFNVQMGDLVPLARADDNSTNTALFAISLSGRIRKESDGKGWFMNAHSRYAIALVVSQLACSLIAGCRPATDIDKPDVPDKRHVPCPPIRGASPNWGLLVAPQSGLPTPIKSTYFFPGAPLSGRLRDWTFMPIDEQEYSTETTTARSRAFIVDQMAHVGVNAISCPTTTPIAAPPWNNMLMHRVMHRHARSAELPCMRWGLRRGVELRFEPSDHSIR